MAMKFIERALQREKSKNGLNQKENNSMHIRNSIENPTLFK